MRVLLSHPQQDIGVVFPEAALNRLQGIAEVIWNPLERRMTADEFREAAQDVDAVVTEWYTGGDRRFFDAQKRLRLFVRAAERLNNIDLEAASRNGIIVAHIPERYMAGVVQLISAYLLCLATGIWEQQGALRRDGTIMIRRPGIDLAGKAIGLIGLGRIGRKVATMAAGWGMEVLAHDPNLSSPRQAARLVSLECLMSEARFVVVTCPLTPRTEGLVSRKLLERMKPDTYFINTARGKIVDESALADLLNAERIAGAAVDVFSDEPVVRNNPLMTARNTIVTPHIAGHTEEAYFQEAMGAVDAVKAVSEGRWPRHVANPDVFSKILANRGQWRISEPPEGK